MKPEKSYIIWFSQRTGSTLLCKALESTGIAGRPGELLHAHQDYDLLKKYGLKSHSILQKHLWEEGSSVNGVFGLKLSYYQPHQQKMTEIFRKFPGANEGMNRYEVWENAFPDCKHIFMTRRNKIRLAVSWWKAIKSGEWHRKYGQKPVETDIADKYLFAAIDHLVSESIFREAGIQEFLAEGNITPLTIVYEDFVNNYESTIRQILDFLEIGYDDNLKIVSPYYSKLADQISEEWVQRYRREKQEDWNNKGW